jgi:phosphoribosylaminoimidazolecarboxamide formyltransferase/IMP cyclohydrolase
MALDLKYGCNPHQGSASLSSGDNSGDAGPLRVLNGTPSYINILDALGAWQLVRELRQATGLASAASFKHVSPAGAAVAGELSDVYRQAQMLGDDELSPVATAYVRARGGDRMCSFGDVVAVSDPVDVSLANVLRREVSDLIIAPGFDEQALQILMRKKQGKYLIFQIDPDYEPPQVESREVFGFTLQQQRNCARIGPELFSRTVDDKAVPDAIVQTLVVATIALKYTQSNSVCLAYDGQVIGMGAGQQSRIHCTRLACDKAEKWCLQQHPRVLGLNFKQGLKRPEKANVIDQYLLWDELSEPEERAMLDGLQDVPKRIDRAERYDWIRSFEGICLSSDAFIPFRDNIDRAGRTNVQYVAQTGNSMGDEQVTAAANQCGMAMIHTDLRCFLH